MSMRAGGDVTTGAVKQSALSAGTLQSSDTNGTESRTIEAVGAQYRACMK